MIKSISSSTTSSYAGRTFAFNSVECCGKPVSMKAVKGTHNAEIACSSKCTSSKGHVCECSCGGKNHGAGHAS